MVRNRWVLASTAAALLLLSVNCSDPNAPISANPANTVAAMVASADSVGVDRRTEHERLKELLKQMRDSLKAERALHHEEFVQAREQWHLTQQAWKRAKKTGEAPALLACEPQEYAADAELIGPAGGTLKIGPHELEIPKGALDHEVVISGAAPVSDAVEVQFEPEGLQFARPAELKLSYAHCLQPPSWLNLFIVYLGADNQVLDITSSVDKKGLKAVYGDLHHFSRYAVAW